MIGAALLLVALAGASEPCPDMPEPPPERLSVAWISPLRKQTNNDRLLHVVPTRDLAAWVTEHPGATPGDLLRYVGMRKRDKEPKRRFKVVIFETVAGALCRPILELEEGTPFAGLPACPGGTQPKGRDYPMCGYTVDHNTGREGAEVYQARWRDLAAHGFCVIPIERFLAESGR